MSEWHIGNSFTRRGEKFKKKWFKTSGLWMRRRPASHHIEMVCLPVYVPSHHLSEWYHESVWITFCCHKEKCVGGKFRRHIQTWFIWLANLLFVYMTEHNPNMWAHSLDRFSFESRLEGTNIFQVSSLLSIEFYDQLLLFGIHCGNI